MPHSGSLSAEPAHRVNVAGHSVVPIVSTENHAKPRSLSRQRLVPTELKLRFDLIELGLQPFTHGMSDQQKVPIPGSATNVCKAQEVEGLWLTLPLSGSLHGGKD